MDVACKKQTFAESFQEEPSRVYVYRNWLNRRFKIAIDQAVAGANTKM